MQSSEVCLTICFRTKPDKFILLWVAVKGTTKANHPDMLTVTLQATPWVCTNYWTFGVPTSTSVFPLQEVTVWAQKRLMWSVCSFTCFLALLRPANFIAHWPQWHQTYKKNTSSPPITVNKRPKAAITLPTALGLGPEPWARKTVKQVFYVWNTNTN